MCAMMGRLNHDQGQLFYSFCLADAVPDDHRIREIAAVLDLEVLSFAQEWRSRGLELRLVDDIPDSHCSLRAAQ